jgi:hypothetical protein
VLNGIEPFAPDLDVLRLAPVLTRIATRQLKR